MILKHFKYVALAKISFMIIGISIVTYEYFTNIEKLENKQEAQNIVFIMDVSNSMNVDDVKGKYSVPISRLELAKNYVENVIDNLDGIKFGIILFSKNSNFYIPPTYDKETIKKYLEVINTSTIMYGGTNIRGGLEEFINIQQDNYIGILLSDMGESQQTSKLKQSISDLKSNKKIYAIGLGSEQGGSIKYSNGEYLQSDEYLPKSNRNDQFGEYVGKKFGGNYYIIQDIKDINTLNPGNINKFMINKEEKQNINLLIGIFMILIGL